MGRIITDARKVQILTARKSDPDALGPQLGELILAGNLPVGGVASLLAVSEPTIYRWMYGEAHPRDADKIEKIKEVLVRLNKARAVGDFPLKGSMGDRLVALFALFGDDSIGTVEQSVSSSDSPELIPGLSEMSWEQRLTLAQKVYELAKKNLASGGGLDGRPITQECFAGMNRLRKEIAETRAHLERDNVVTAPQVTVRANTQVLLEDQLNMQRTTINQLSYKDKVWRRIVDGEETKLQRKDPDTGDLVPMPVVNLVVLDYSKARSRAYYWGDFVEGENPTPRCASVDGVKPDADVKEPCAATCAACPNAVMGSKITDNGKQSTLCQPFKRIAVVPSGAGIATHPPMLLYIAHASMWDKDNPHEAQGWYAWEQYLDMLRARGAKHTAAVVTRVKFDPDKTYPKLLFSAAGWTSPEELIAAKTLLIDSTNDIEKILTATSNTYFQNSWGG